MIKTNNISYKIFLFERVKKKIRFFETDTYPLQIRLTAGARTLYLKSHFFTQLQLDKYRQQSFHSQTKISIDDIISCEEELIRYMLNQKANNISLNRIRQDYNFLSRDILHQLDEEFKTFLVNFFYAENLPAFALFIRHDGYNHTSEFILHNLEKSLQAGVYNKLLETAVQEAPPYIPFIHFFREQVHYPLPLFSIYQWREPVPDNFKLYTDQHFPEYKKNDPVKYIDRLLCKPSG